MHQRILVSVQNKAGVPELKIINPKKSAAAPDRKPRIPPQKKPIRTRAKFPILTSKTGEWKINFETVFKVTARAIKIADKTINRIFWISTRKFLRSKMRIKKKITNIKNPQPIFNHKKNTIFHPQFLFSLPKVLDKQ